PRRSARRRGAPPHPAIDATGARGWLSPRLASERMGAGAGGAPRYDPSMIEVTPDIALRDDELVESFVRSSGPGGQNVNKVSTAVELRFDARHSPSLSEGV